MKNISHGHLFDIVILQLILRLSGVLKLQLSKKRLREGRERRQERERSMPSNLREKEKRMPTK